MPVLRIVITDETAAVEAFSSTDSGFTQVGSGAGTTKITSSGTAIVDANAQFSANRNVPLSVAPTQGTFTVSAPGGTSTISGLSGWNEIIACECGGGPAVHRSFSGFPATCHDNPGGPHVIVTSITSSSFVGKNVDSTSDSTNCPVSGSYTVNYAFI